MLDGVDGTMQAVEGMCRGEGAGSNKMGGRKKRCIKKRLLESKPGSVSAGLAEFYT